jgi:hypothetical protein
LHFREVQKYGNEAVCEKLVFRSYQRVFKPSLSNIPEGRGGAPLAGFIAEKLFDRGHVCFFGSRLLPFFRQVGLCR